MCADASFNRELPRRWHRLLGAYVSDIRMNKGIDEAEGKHITIGPWEGSPCSWPCLERETMTRTTVLYPMG